MSDRIPGLTGLRGLACLGVLLAHTWVHWAPATVPDVLLQAATGGLVLFFALSGLVITLPFLRAAVGTGARVSLTHYAARRLARVYPAYVVVFVLSNLAAAVFVRNAILTVRPGSAAGAGSMTAPGDLLANLLLVQTLFPSTIQTGISPAWSLTAELSFYLFVALVVLAFGVRRAAPRHPLALVALGGVALLLLGWVTRAVAESWWRGSGLSGAVAEFGPNGIAVLTLSLPGVADTFAIGVLVAVLVVWLERRVHGAPMPPADVPDRAALRTALLVAAVGTVAIAGYLSRWATDRHPWFVGSAMAIAAGAVLVVVAEPAARGRISRVASLIDNPACFHLGVVSYGAYLWHVPVILTLSRIDAHVPLIGHDSWATALWAAILVCGTSVVLASATWRLVEKPALAWAAAR